MQDNELQYELINGNSLEQDQLKFKTLNQVKDQTQSTIPKIMNSRQRD